MKEVEKEPVVAEENIGKELVIEISNLCKSFDGQEVLKGVSLKLFAGENLVVLGRSGSGKSVLIKCIVKLLLPNSGSINVLGSKVEALNNDELMLMRKKVGFLFQSGALYDSMTVRQNLEFPLLRFTEKLSQSEIDHRINEVLEQVGLLDSIDKMPSQLSGGMRKRISLARTIVVDPVIMLYDEPTTGLDPATSNEISSLIMEIQKKRKTSSLIITHDIACARATANRVVFLLDGEVYKEGVFKDFETSDDPLVKSFFL